MNNKNHVIQNIAFLRKKYHLSQVEFAKIAGVTQATINRWENDLIAPTIDNLFNVCKHFQIEMGTLICKDLSKSENDNLNENKLENKIENLSEEQKDIINKMIDNMK